MRTGGPPGGGAAGSGARRHGLPRLPRAWLPAAAAAENVDGGSGGGV